MNTHVPQTPRAKLLLDDVHGNDSDEDDILDHLPNSGPAPSKLKRTDSTRSYPTFLEAEGLRSLATSPFSELSELGQLTPVRSRSAYIPPAPSSTTSTWKTKLYNARASFWQRNRSVILVGVAQLFGALMNVAARLLETEDGGMHPFRILWVRMGLTAILSCLYMYRTKVPDFPFGPREVRGLLVARGLTGFFGIYGMWYSLMYLPLAEATVITFLAPSVSGYICHVLLHDPFTKKEQIASYLALAGVIFIARPTSLFSSSANDSHATAPSTAVEAGAATNITQTQPPVGDDATPAQRAMAIGVALIGILGASGAYTTIRWIGKRAHPLISVNYFATWCTVVSTVVLIVAPLLDIGQPAIRFALPGSLRQWFLLIFLGICGFVMQFLLTSGLGGEKSNRATAMVYTHMLFAVGFDKWVFGHEMGIMSLIGCSLIVGSALWAVLSKIEPSASSNEADVEARGAEVVEAVPMLAADGNANRQEEETIPLEEVR